MTAGPIARRLAARGLAGGPTVKRGTDILRPYDPKRFDDFVGQTIARSMIIAAVKSAIRRDRPLGHILLASGLPGVGKTTLARLTATLLDTGFVELGGVINERDAIKALRVMEDGDVLFLDEIHRLVSSGKARAEWLLTFLEDGVIQTPGGTFEAPNITVIAATTDAEKLPATILDRFMRPVLEEYTEAEAVQIAAGVALRMGYGTAELPMPSKTEWLQRVARASNNNPRLVTRLLEQVRDIAISGDLSNLQNDEYDISQALVWSGLTEDGLTAQAQNYLIALYVSNGTAGVKTISAAIGEEQVAQTERLLIHKGLIVINSRGRSLTDLGDERAEALVEAANASTPI